MSVPRYLAMTAGDFSVASSLPPRVAWMAMHFSMSSPGLSNRPHTLPPGSLILLDDQIPWSSGHSLEAVCQEAVDTLLRTGAAGLLLDLERPPTEETRRLAGYLAQCCREAGCSIGMPPAYLDQTEAAVFLPPLPCHCPPQTVLEPYRGREIWLEAVPAGCRIYLSGARASVMPEQAEALEAEGAAFPTFSSGPLHCRYFSKPVGSGIQLSLYDTEETLLEKLDACESLGVTRAVGIWRQIPAWKRAPYQQ